MRPSDSPALLCALLCGVSLLFGCGDEGESSDDEGDTGIASLPGCTSDEGMTYAAGVSLTGAGGVTIAIADAAPAPPDVGDNTWALEVRDADGNPVDDLSITLTPFMPQHGHGTTPPTFEAEGDDDAGMYETEPIDLFMPGLWEITIEVTDGSDMNDSVEFAFCLEG